MILDHFLLISAVLIIISIGISKLFDNVGLPALILFIGVGMLAGSNGIGGLEFDDYNLAQSIGIIALIFILFSGGLETQFSAIKKVLYPGISLATIGVLITAVTAGIFFTYLLDIPLIYGLLIGSIISSTDAAAVFSILRSKNSSLKAELQPLLEFESGSNDPMAVFLTISCIELIIIPGSNFFDIILLFIMQMGVGGLLGIGFGYAMVYLMNRMRFSYPGIYPVFALAFSVFIYSFTVTLNGSGFLAVYVAGLLVGNSSFIQKRGMVRFFDGLAWLGQITMFVALGLLVYPNEMIDYWDRGLLGAAFLIFIARPSGVYFSLLFTRFNIKEKLFISWVGLKGAVPIILATFPIIAGTDHSSLIFNIIFFIVITSALLQGWSLPSMAKFFNVWKPAVQKNNYPIEFNPSEEIDSELIDFIVPFNSEIAGKSIVELDFPDDSRIVMIWRNEKSIIPSGGTVIDEGDALLILVHKGNIEKIKQIVSKQKTEVKK